MYVSTPHTCNAFGTQKRVLEPPGIGVMVGCEPPYGFWELNLGLLQEQQVLITAEPSLLGLNSYFCYRLFISDILGSRNREAAGSSPNKWQ